MGPAFRGALGCLGLFFGARRWLGRFGGAAAVGLFCSAGAALLFAWRDYMPTFTEASLIAAGTGALLWALFGAGLWAFADMRDHAFLGPHQVGGPQGRVARPGVPHAIVGEGTSGNGAAS